MSFDPLAIFNINEKVRVSDGGFGSLLMELGYKSDKITWGAGANLTEPDFVVDAHKLYIDSGASVISTNTYQANLLRLNETKAIEEPEKIIQESVKLAKQAIGTSEVHILGSIGPYATYLADASEYTGAYLNKAKFDIANVKKNYILQATALKNAGANVLLFETIPSAVEAKIAREVLEEMNLHGIISASCKDNLHTNYRDSFFDFVRNISSSPNVLAIGINCTSPIYINSLLNSVKDVRNDKPFMVYSNSGEVYNEEHGDFSGRKSTDIILDEIPDWVALGVRIVGGCCRVGPAEIKLIEKVDTITI